MTTYGYARVSTDSQTLDAQLHALALRGIPTSHIASDDGVSGTVPWAERPGLQMLVDAMQRGDTLVAVSLSRVGRSTVDVLNLMAELDRRGIKFVSLSESFDTSSAMGRAMLSIMAALGQLERDLGVERTKAGLAAARARGVKLGRQEVPGRRDVVEAGLAAGKRPVAIALETGIPLRTVVRMMKRMGATTKAA